jgi:hypothetical protein
MLSLHSEKEGNSQFINEMDLDYSQINDSIFIDHWYNAIKTSSKISTHILIIEKNEYCLKT